MSWLSIHDFITPTNPWAALFFGLMFAIIMATFIWFETKEKRAFFIALLVVSMTSIIIVLCLYMLGFYS